MGARYFTPAEANDALDDVRPLAEEMVERRRALAALQTRHEAFEQRIASNGGDFDPGELRELQEQIAEESASVARCVARIHEAGAQVKDLDAGLVDFPARRGDEDVLLCWRVGESEIEYWHRADEGFAGRKPLPL